MKTTSRMALVAAVGLMIGGSALPAKAADLGGDCCADLEERVAELEATTVRKGNRKVSLELSGQVNKALLAWDDGKTSDAYVTDYNYSSTRIRLKGTGQMTTGWKAGFWLEYEFRDASSNLVDQTLANNRGIESTTTLSGTAAPFSSVIGPGPLRIRQENVFVESERFGRVTLGQQNAATKDLTLINLGGGLNDPENYIAAGFFLRDSSLGNTLGAAGIITQGSRLTWNNFSNALDAQRLELIRYDTPSLWGFIFSASWGQNDFWDVALRYQKEFNQFRIAGGIGYAYYGDPVFLLQPDGLASSQVLNNGCNNVGPNGVVGPAVPFGPCTRTQVVSGVLSMMHIPTGIYLTFVGGQRHLTDPSVTVEDAGNPDGAYFYLQFGITKRFFDVGATTLYGEYGSYQDFAAGARYDGTLSGPAIRINTSDTNRWGFGFTQAFDNAALELYSNYIHYSTDNDATCLDAGPLGSGCPLAGGRYVGKGPEDFDAVISGARIKF